MMRIKTLLFACVLNGIFHAVTAWLASSTKKLHHAAVGNSHLSLSSVDATDSIASSSGIKESNSVVAPSNSKYSSSAKKQKVAVLMCPAQFCVPDDYTALWPTLRQTLEESDNCPIELAESSRVVPLSRLDWIKVARQLPTAEFFQAQLPVRPTLYWYFDAIEQALADILAAEGPDVHIAMVGHSIGGWIARAYLGGMSHSASATYRLAVERCISLVTLGTPHISPAEALVDQTRGLLEAIEATPSCSPRALMKDAGISVTCVVSQALAGSWSPTNIEGLVAAASYAPLTGKWNNVKGDGIVPLDLALLPAPARSLIIDKDSITGQDIHHLHVLPTPWNLWAPSAPSLPLGFSSYVSPGVVSQWAQCVYTPVQVED